MKKKILLIIMLLFTLILGVNKVEAVNIQDVKTIGYKKYTYNGTQTINKVIYFTADSKTAYCVELKRNFDHTINAGESTKNETLNTFLNNLGKGSSYATANVAVTYGGSTVRIPRKDYINLVAYYGDKLATDENGGTNTYYLNINARRYYLAAQTLIWKQTSPSITLYGIYGTYTNGTLGGYKNLTTEINTINQNIVNFYKKPSFCGTEIEVKSSDTSIELEDDNKVLEGYNNMMEGCNKNSNVMTCNITPSSTTNISISKSIGSGNTQVLSRNYTASSGQKVMNIGKTEINCEISIKTVQETTARIKKVDANNDPIEGINFKVCQATYDVNNNYAPSANQNGHYTSLDNCIDTTEGTNDDGYINLPNPYTDHSSPSYTFNPADNHAICFYELNGDSDKYIIRGYPMCNVVNKNITRTFINHFNSAAGTVTINKIDINNKAVKNVSFSIYDKNDNFIAEIETNENGIATSNRIPKGDYYLVEANAPENIIIDNSTKYYFHIVNNNDEATLYSDNNYTTAITDNKIINELQNAKIKIIKIDKDSNKLKGVKFEIYKITDIINGNAGELKTPDDEVTDASLGAEKKELITTVTTDENGEAIIDNLDYGKYRIIETETLKEYILLEDPTEVIINENKIYEVTINNEKSPQTADVRIVLIITLGLCTLVIAIIAYTKRNQILKNNTI